MDWCYYIFYDLIFWCNDNYLRPQLHNRDQLALGLATFSQYEKNILTGNQFHHQCPATASQPKRVLHQETQTGNRKTSPSALALKPQCFKRHCFALKANGLHFWVALYFLQFCHNWTSKWQIFASRYLLFKVQATYTIFQWPRRKDFAVTLSLQAIPLCQSQHSLFTTIPQINRK